ncbi:hypothetical protein AAG906_031661 [Vitis piasezkii]
MGGGVRAQTGGPYLLRVHLHGVLVRVKTASHHFNSSPMAALLSVSSAPSSRTPLFLHHPSSPFKGNVRNLKANPCQFLTIKLEVKGKVRKSGVVVASQGSPSSVVDNVRFRLDNLGPQPGSRKKAKRKGRGISAGQGNSCGFGMRGQKSRSGPGVMKGFEGGQMPLYRRIPKLRGIAGASISEFFILGDAGLEVSLDSLKKKGLINPSGRERRLPLKILGAGELSVKLNIKARAFSSSAKEKLEAAGCSITVLPGRKKWLKPSVIKNLARAEEYFAKKRAAAEQASS